MDKRRVIWLVVVVIVAVGTGFLLSDADFWRGFMDGMNGR
jgi:hypothetical protein